jgi:TolA-binding protein
MEDYLMRMPLMAAALLLSTALSGLAPAHAQEAIDSRVGKLEKEMKAVQRKVFPGGDTKFFEAEIAPPPPTDTAAGIPATTPLADVTARVGALESELARLTGQVEQNSFKLRQLEEGFAKLKGDTEFRLNTLEGGAVPPKPGGPSTAAAASSVAAPPPTVTGPSTPPPAKPPADTATAAPLTGDAGEDAYMAGYRLWMDKKFPEAEAALKDVVAKYPKHKRASYAQNLLGRTYLDEGKPALAAEAFYANYQKMPRGERAPDSLYYLGQSLVQLKKPKEACRVYDELMDVYGASMAASLKDKVTKGRADAKCTAA